MECIGSFVESQPFIALFLVIGLGYVMIFPGVGNILKIIPVQSRAALRNSGVIPPVG